MVGTTVNRQMTPIPGTIASLPGFTPAFVRGQPPIPPRFWDRDWFPVPERLRSRQRAASDPGPPHTPPRNLGGPHPTHRSPPNQGGQHGIAV